MKNKEKIIYKTQLDGTELTLSVNPESYTDNIAIQVTGADAPASANMFYQLLMQKLSDDGYDITTRNYNPTQPPPTLYFTPHRLGGKPGSDILMRERDDPTACSQAIQEIMVEMEAITEAHRLYTGNDLPFPELVGEMHKRYPSAPREVVPPIQEIRARTSNNVPRAELAIAIYHSLTETGLENRYPVSIKELEAMAEKLAIGIDKTLSARPGWNVPDHKLRSQLRQQLTAMASQNNLPPELVDEFMTSYIAAIHDAKRRHPPFTR